MLVPIRAIVNLRLPLDSLVLVKLYRLILLVDPIITTLVTRRLMVPLLNNIKVVTGIFTVIILLALRLRVITLPFTRLPR